MRTFDPHDEADKAAWLAEYKAAHTPKQRTWKETAQLAGFGAALVSGAFLIPIAAGIIAAVATGEEPSEAIDKSVKRFNRLLHIDLKDKHDAD